MDVLSRRWCWEAAGSGGGPLQGKKEEKPAKKVDPVEAELAKYSIIGVNEWDKDTKCPLSPHLSTLAY